MNFKPNDKVTAWGLDGYVMVVDKLRHMPITVQFENGEIDSFLSDGRAMDWHLLPSLFKIVTHSQKIGETPDMTEVEMSRAYGEGWGMF